ncbi:membrane protein, partial [Xanthomonas vasicola pv. musacearum NCPPB 4392]
MFQSLSSLLLDSIVLALPIIGIVRFPGVRLNWATLAA